MDPIGYAWIPKISENCTQNGCKLDNRKMQTHRFYSAATQNNDVDLFHFFWTRPFPPPQRTPPINNALLRAK